jgi:hypothetical protein
VADRLRADLSIPDEGDGLDYERAQSVLRVLKQDAEVRDLFRAALGIQ